MKHGVRTSCKFHSRVSFPPTADSTDLAYSPDLAYTDDTKPTDPYSSLTLTVNKHPESCCAKGNLN